MPPGEYTDRYHHGDLRNALLQAGEALLREHGPGRLSLRELARHAGVSHAAPYRHFRDRAALLQALAGRGFERLRAAMRTAVARVPHGPEQQLHAASLAYVRLAVENPELTQLMFGSVASRADPVADEPPEEAVLAVLHRIIESGISIGAFRRRPARELARVVWVGMHGVAMLVTAGMLEADSGDVAALDALVASVTGHVIYGISR